VGVELTTIDRLDGWKAAGIISDAQHATLAEIVRRERFSLFVELHALLYIGVISVVAGLGWTFRDYVTSLGDVAILSMLGLLMAVSFGYCFMRGPAYSNDEVESPSFAFDYILYFACLVLGATLAFIETRFAIFHKWDQHLLIASIVFGVLAYRFDNRFVLSLALSTLAGYLGLTIDLFDTLNSERLRLAGFLYGSFLIGAGILLDQRRIKAHFLDVYLQLGANAIFLAAASGVIDSRAEWLYLLALLILAAAAIYLGIRFRRFAFVAYGTLYGYAGLSIRLLDVIGGFTGVLFYFAVTGSIVILGLVIVARRFGRDE
jgi:hypothetical protein